MVFWRVISLSVRYHFEIIIYLISLSVFWLNHLILLAGTLHLLVQDDLVGQVVGGENALLALRHILSCVSIDMLAMLIYCIFIFLDISGHFWHSKLGRKIWLIGVSLALLDDIIGPQKRGLSLFSGLILLV